jgi:hypothetical protein
MVGRERFPSTTGDREVQASSNVGSHTKREREFAGMEAEVVVFIEKIQTEERAHRVSRWVNYLVCFL